MNRSKIFMRELVVMVGLLVSYHEISNEEEDLKSSQRSNVPGHSWLFCDERGHRIRCHMDVNRRQRQSVNRSD